MRSFGQRTFFEALAGPLKVFVRFSSRICFYHLQSPSISIPREMSWFFTYPIENPLTFSTFTWYACADLTPSLGPLLTHDLPTDFFSLLQELAKFFRAFGLTVNAQQRLRAGRAK